MHTTEICACVERARDREPPSPKPGGLCVAFPENPERVSSMPNTRSQGGLQGHDGAECRAARGACRVEISNEASLTFAARKHMTRRAFCPYLPLQLKNTDNSINVLTCRPSAWFKSRETF